MFCLKLECCKLRKAVCHPTKYHIINDIKLFYDSISQDILSQISKFIQLERASIEDLLNCYSSDFTEKESYIILFKSFLASGDLCLGSNKVQHVKGKEALLNVTYLKPTTLAL